MSNPSRLALTLIIGNEFCERFCFYGFRTLLFLYLRTRYSLLENQAIKIVHLFNFACYFFTFLGGILSDALIGRYRTIFYLSIIYLLGTLLTTLSTIYLNFNLLICGLFCISLGTGGIKPCVSTFGGDQFPKNAEKAKLTKFFSFFYLAINAGSTLAIFCMPILSNMSCFGAARCYFLAFGLPTLLMGVSLLLFMYGNVLFVKKMPDSSFIVKYFRWLMFLVYKPKNAFRKNSCINLDAYIVKPQNDSLTLHKRSWYKHTADEFGIGFAQDMRKALKILNIFSLVPFYWMLYDQQATTWVGQGTHMQTGVIIWNQTYHILPEQMQALNGVLILVFIPLFSHVVYPIVKRLGYNFHSLRKMTAGMLFASISFFFAALVERSSSKNIHIMWQLPQYIFLTIGEVLLAVTGIEFAYTQAPKSLKGIILSAWLITVAIGNLYVIFLASVDVFKWLKFDNASTYNFLIYGCIGLVATYYLHRNAVKYNQRTKKQVIEE